MLVVTGGAGFIGSNLVKELNNRGHENIIVVDDLSDGKKFINLVDCDISDYLDKDNFIEMIEQQHPLLENIEVIFHQGACSTTTEWDGRFMMDNNYEYSKKLLHYCAEKKIPFLYASSAAVYGGNKEFSEHRKNQLPLNVYGYSKHLFDQYVRRHIEKISSQVVGFRYFNVYGPREQHKGNMASVAYHLNQQIQQNGVVKLFAACDGYGNGEQQRDFVYVEDVVHCNLWFWQQRGQSGIYNLGTGSCQTFNEVANAVINWHGQGQLEYIPFPEHLRGCYQSYTQADITALRAAGYDADFNNVAQGVKKYLDWLNTDAR